MRRPRLGRYGSDNDISNDLINLKDDIDRLIDTINDLNIQDVTIATKLEEYKNTILPIKTEVTQFIIEALQNELKNKEN